MKALAHQLLAACLLVCLSLTLARAADPGWPGEISRLRTQLAGAPEDSGLRRAVAAAHNNYAVALAKERQWDLAGFYAEEALRLDPGDPQVRDNLAQIYLRHAQDRYQGAVQGGDPPRDAAAIRGLVEQALATSPELGAAHVLLGDLEYTLGSRDAAAIAWWRAKALAPDLAGLAERLARVQGGAEGAVGSGPTKGGWGDPAKAVAELRERRRRAPDDERLRRDLAEAHHRLGLALAEAGNWDEALGNLRSAARLAPETERYRRSLAQTSLDAATELRRGLARGLNAPGSVEEAKRLLEQAIEADPRLASAYLALGDIEYDGQRLGQARQAWLKAGELDPKLEGVGERLRRLAGEYAAESGMTGVEGYDFILQYEEDVADSLGFDVRDRLNGARRVVGEALDHWPKRRIVVLLYRMGTYRRVRHQAPVWSAGLYDGKIRIPLPETRGDIATVEGTIVHEYVHAVVHDLTGGNCPRWLNEGLAELFEAPYSRRDPLAAVRAAARNGGLIPWAHVDQQFESASADGARRGYDQAHSMVAFLKATYGAYGLRRVLDALGAGAEIAPALTREFGLTPAELELGWRRWLGGAG